MNVNGTAGEGVGDGICTGCLPVMLSTLSLTARGAGPVIDIVVLTTGGDGRRRRWGWDSRVSLPSSTLWVRVDVVNVDDTAGEGVSDGSARRRVLTCDASRRRFAPASLTGNFQSVGDYKSPHFESFPSPCYVV